MPGGKTPPFAHFYMTIPQELDSSQVFLAKEVLLDIPNYHLNYHPNFYKYLGWLTISSWITTRESHDTMFSWHPHTGMLDVDPDGLEWQ